MKHIFVLLAVLLSFTAIAQKDTTKKETPKEAAKVDSIRPEELSPVDSVRVTLLLSIAELKFLKDYVIANSREHHATLSALEADIFNQYMYWLYNWRIETAKKANELVRKQAAGTPPKEVKKE